MSVSVYSGCTQHLSCQFSCITREYALVKESRWRLFGHILRQAATIPAAMTKNLYFTAAANGGWRGRPRNTLPTVLHADITRAGQGSLSNASDLDHLREIAKDRPQWQQICKRICQV
eukprot:scpid105198/ scgid17948/ 